MKKTKGDLEKRLKDNDLRYFFYQIFRTLDRKNNTQEFKMNLKEKETCKRSKEKKKSRL